MSTRDGRPTSTFLPLGDLFAFTFWYLLDQPHNFLNAKKTSFWDCVEGRLMAMLEGDALLTFGGLNLDTQV
jgi:hypothetical protein